MQIVVIPDYYNSRILLISIIDPTVGATSFPLSWSAAGTGVTDDLPSANTKKMSDKFHRLCSHLGAGDGASVGVKEFISQLCVVLESHSDSDFGHHSSTGRNDTVNLTITADALTQCEYLPNTLLNTRKLVYCTS